MALNEFSGNVVDSLNAQDQANMDLLNQVVTAATKMTVDGTENDVMSIDQIKAQVNNPIDDRDGDGYKDAHNADGSIVGDTNKDGVENEGETFINKVKYGVEVSSNGVHMSSEAATKLANDNGAIYWGGKVASLQGTGGVALLEFAKDAIQTAVSNITGVGTNGIQMRKAAERKFSS